MDDIVRGIECEDAAGGDGGKEMLDALRDAFRYVHPDKGFQTIKDYLHFRHFNVGAALVFSLRSCTVPFDIVAQVRRCRREVQHQIPCVFDRPAV